MMIIRDTKGIINISGEGRKEGRKEGGKIEVTLGELNPQIYFKDKGTRYKVHRQKQNMQTSTSARRPEIRTPGW